MRWNFKIVSKNLSFRCLFADFLAKFIFFNTRNAIWTTNSCIFFTSDYVVTIWYSYLHELISELIHSKSALNQHSLALKTQSFIAKKISAKQRRFRAAFQVWTALIQRKSELIFSETELISANFFHVLWISAVQCYLSLGCQPGKGHFRQLTDKRVPFKKIPTSYLPISANLKTENFMRVVFVGHQ